MSNSGGDMVKGDAQLCEVTRDVTQHYNLQRGEHSPFDMARYVTQPSDIDRSSYQSFAMVKDTHEQYDLARDVEHQFEINRNATPSYVISRNVTHLFDVQRGIQPQFEMVRGGDTQQYEMSRSVAQSFELQSGSASYDIVKGPQGYETGRGTHQYEMPRTQPYEVRAGTDPVQLPHQYNYDKGYQDCHEPQDIGPAKGNLPEPLPDTHQGMEIPLEMPKTAPQHTVRTKGGQKTTGHPFDFAKGYAQQLEMAKRAAQSAIQAKIKAQKEERAKEEAEIAEKNKREAEEKARTAAQPSEILKLYAQQLQMMKHTAKPAEVAKIYAKQQEVAKAGVSKSDKCSKKLCFLTERLNQQKSSAHCDKSMRGEVEKDQSGGSGVETDDAEGDHGRMEDEQGDPPPFEMAKYMAQLSKTKGGSCDEEKGHESSAAKSIDDHTNKDSRHSPTEVTKSSGLPFTLELMKNFGSPFGMGVKGVGGPRAKRDRQELTIANKAKLIDQVESRGTKKKADIAREWGLRPSTLSTIMKNKEKIITQFKSQRYAVGRRRMRTAAYPDVEEALLTWFRYARAAGIPITGPVLQGMGVTLAQELGHPEFSCSVGWLDRFKARHGLSFNPKNSQDSGVTGTFNEPPDRVPSPLAATPQETTSDSDASLHSWYPPSMPAVATRGSCPAENSSHSWFSNAVTSLNASNEERQKQLNKWLPETQNIAESGDASPQEDPATSWLNDTIPALLKDKRPMDIFSAGETALFYNLLPDRYLAVKEEDGHKWTWLKERITLMVGVNMDGSEKLPLLVIGQKNPADQMKDVEDHSVLLPLPYEVNDSAMMTSAVFESWVRQLDQQYQTSNRTISLIVEGCPAHSCPEDLKNVQLVFLPADTTSRLQPVELGVIHTLKSLYRRSVLERLVQALEAGLNYEVTLHKAMELLGQAWKQVKSEVIVESFKQAGLEAAEDPADGKTSGVDELALLERARRSGLDIPKEVTFESYLNVDSQVQTTVEQEESELRVNEEGTGGPTLPDEAMHALATLRKFILEQDGPSTFLDPLADLESWVAKHIVKPEVSMTE